MIDQKSKIIKKLNNKEAVIGIFGIGYVGLPLSLAFAEAGFKVIGFDIDEKKVELLNRSKSPINNISSERIKKIQKLGLFEATYEFSLTSKVDSIIICVPTPLNINREPDMSYIKSTLNSILPFLEQGKIISLESTTYPGTTEDFVKPLVEKEGFEVGKDIFLIYSPEREDPGNSKYTTTNIPKVVGGCSTDCREIGICLYKNIIQELVPVSSTKVAEMTKLLENIHRAVNIGLINEMKLLMNEMDIDLYEVIDAAATKPFGFVPYYPGPGLGGHCIPIDPFYLTWKAREFGQNIKFIELAGEINLSMPKYVLNKVSEALNTQSKALKGSKTLILGISYKKNIDDTRESPSVDVMKLLQEYGSSVKFHDPFFQKFPKMRKFSFDGESIELNPKNLSEFDAVILTTDHDIFDYEMIRQNSNLIIDTRGRYDTSEFIFRA